MRLLILVLLIYVLYRIVRKFLASGPKYEKTTPGREVDELVQDPFCKTYVPLREAEKRVIDGKEYFFCSRECADKYLKERNA